MSTDLRAISIFFGLGPRLCIRHLDAAAEHRMPYHRIDRDGGFESRRQACRRLVDANSWVAKPSQAVQYRRD